MNAGLMHRAPAFPLGALTRRRLAALLAVIAGVVIVCLAVVAMADLDIAAISAENGPVEWLQVAFYSTAAVCFFAAATMTEERLHRLAFAGFGLFIVVLTLRELDFTRSGTPTLALVFNSRGTIAVMALAWLGLAAVSWRDPLGLFASGLRWLGGRGGRPLLAAAVLLLCAWVFDQHLLPVGRTVDLVGEEALELAAASLVLLSAFAAVHVSRSAATA
ncbi:hypothetical protein RUR49_16590 [Pseudoxanthobacter sp. M-2]|uniref:hypothetical protein n=1 Tax=Pseudoxanthobacter sp. M-2 TaxID=3078754 RepID=UPI0038FD369E